MIKSLRSRGSVETFHVWVGIRGAAWDRDTLDPHRIGRSDVESATAAQAPAATLPALAGLSGDSVVIVQKDTRGLSPRGRMPDLLLDPGKRILTTAFVDGPAPASQVSSVDWLDLSRARFSMTRRFGFDLVGSVALVVAAVACGGSGDSEEPAPGGAGGQAGTSGAAGTSGGATDSGVDQSSPDGSAGRAGAAGSAGDAGSAGSAGSADADASGDSGDGGPPPVVTTTYASRLAAGFDKACVITTTGALKCWGAFREPETLAAGLSWKQVSVGGLNDPNSLAGCAVRSDDTLWCWAYPGASLTQPDTNTFSYVRVAMTNRCAIATTGELYCWGTNNVFGPLGTGDTNPRANPTQIGADTDWKLVAPGKDHTCAIKSSGALWCWGWNAFGQVGIGSTTQGQYDAPVAVDESNTYLDVDARGVQTCGVRSDGSLLCWGSGAGTNNPAPTAVDSTKDWAKVRIGAGFACALKQDGSLYCWGSNDRGQLALPVATGSLSKATPQMIGVDKDWDDVAAGDAFACAKKKTGTVWCWGSNSSGQLAKTPIAVPTPKRIDTPGEFAWAGAGPNTVCAVRKNGSLACWGTAGGMPEVGVALQTPHAIGTATDWKTVKPGWAGACATKSNDALHCWNVGAAPSSTSLTASAYDVGYDHQCAIVSGSMYCWGNNIFSKCGVPMSVPTATPTKIGTDTWTSVAANFDSTCGIKTGGTMWCWGFGVSTGMAQAGSAANWTEMDRTPGANLGWYGLAGGKMYTWISANPPAASGAEADWTSIAVGAWHVCGIRTGGALWCKGANESGQLGDGTLTARDNAVQIGADTDWKMLTAGTAFTCGLRTSGDLYCWGSNDYGEMGDGNSFRSTVGVVP
jgi:alpha-tubulin suppressor-like RCC1 family protein